MMKQQLWVLNSSLLFMFLFILLISSLLQQTPPLFRIKPPYLEEMGAKKELPQASIESIYKNDLFGTFIPQQFTSSPQSLVTPIPQPKSVSIPKPPEPAKPEFLPPLNVSLKGIAYSPDEEKSISMVADETNKEQIYHLGDMVKDAQLIKIAKNRVTLIRTNGQHETFFLRKDDNKGFMSTEKEWDHVVKKIGENTYQIDSIQFPKEIPTLGDFAQTLLLLTVYRNGVPEGLKIGEITEKNLGIAMGLQKNDVITAINDIKTADKKNRINIYDMLSQIKTGDTIRVSLQRNNNPLTISYQLDHIEKTKKREFMPTKEKKGEEKKEELFKMTKLQEREKRLREFTNKHQTKQQNAIEEIRARLLENMRARSRNARIR